jgi:hypothetical protein
MNGKCVSVLLGRLCSDLLYILLLLVKVPLYDKFSRTICWDFMTGRDSCVNQGRHVSGALKLLGKVGGQPRSLNWYLFSEHKIKSRWEDHLAESQATKRGFSGTVFNIV